MLPLKVGLVFIPLYVYLGIRMHLGIHILSGRSILLIMANMHNSKDPFRNEQTLSSAVLKVQAKVSFDSLLDKHIFLW